MDDEKSTNMKCLTMDEIFKNLLSYSENETPWEDTVHVYKPRELQSGWLPVRCNAKYITCPERLSPSTSVKNVDLSSPKQKRHANKDKKKDLKQKEVSDNFNKYESLGVLSYGVPSWRTIVDPDTFEYLKRGHPCHVNRKTSGTCNGIRFLNPGVALDLHLGGFVKRQNTNNIMQSSNDGDICTGFKNGQFLENKVQSQLNDFPQRICPFPDDRLLPHFASKNALLLGSSIQSTPKPKIAPLVTLKHHKTGIHNSVLPLPKRGLSPLVTANRVTSLESRFCSKNPKDLTPSQQRHFSLFSKPIIPPVKDEVTKRTKRSLRDQKLNWLPITSTMLHVQSRISVHQSENPDVALSNGLSHSKINQAITQLQNQLPDKQKIVLATRLQPRISRKVLELPLTLTGLH